MPLCWTANDRKLKELANTINERHQAARGAYRTFLQNAKLAGDALRESKTMFKGKGRGRWGKWCKANFDWSSETIRIYMRVSRNWNDQRLVEATAQNMRVKTVQDFLNILRNIHPKDEAAAKMSPAQAKHSLGIDLLRKEFAEWLKQRTEREIEAVERVFTEWLDSMCEQHPTMVDNKHKQWICTTKLVCLDWDPPDGHEEEPSDDAPDNENHDYAAVSNDSDSERSQTPKGAVEALTDDDRGREFSGFSGGPGVGPGFR